MIFNGRLGTRFSFAVAGCLLFAWSAVSVGAQAVQMNLPAGNYAKQIGPTALEDPSGVTHTRQEVQGKVVVAIFSEPNMDQGSTQEKWSKLLADQADTKISDSVVLVLVEDMVEAGMFRGMALNDMKQHFTPDARPFLILDQNGDVFKRFGVDRHKTEILIYDKSGTLRDVESDLADEAGTVQRVNEISALLLAE